jgi:hypothetical protein
MLSLAFVVALMIVACDHPPSKPAPSPQSSVTTLPTPTMRGDPAEPIAWTFFRDSIAPSLSTSGEPFERELLADPSASITLDSRSMPGAEAARLRPIRQPPRIYFGHQDDVPPNATCTQVRLTLRATEPPAPADGGWVLLMVVCDSRVRLVSQTCEGAC